MQNMPTYVFYSNENHLKYLSVNEHIRNIILHLNVNSKSRVQVDGEFPDKVLTYIVIGLGNSFSPLLCSVFLD